MKPQPKVNKPCTEFVMSDKSSIKICLSTLEKLWKQAKEAGQDAEIVIGLRRNNAEIFTISGKLEIEGQRKI